MGKISISTRVGLCNVLNKCNNKLFISCLLLTSQLYCNYFRFKQKATLFQKLYYTSIYPNFTPIMQWIESLRYHHTYLEPVKSEKEFYVAAIAAKRSLSVRVLLVKTERIFFHTHLIGLKFFLIRPTGSASIMWCLPSLKTAASRNLGELLFLHETCKQ